MKVNIRYILTVILTISAFISAFPQVESSFVKEASMTREENQMKIDILFDISDMKLKSKQAEIFIPLVVNGPDTLALPQIGVFGKARWYKFERNNKLPFTSDKDINLRYNKDLGEIPYQAIVKYEDWMNGSEILLKRENYGCANCMTSYVDPEAMASYFEITKIFEPQYIYREAIVETVKTRELSGKAYIDFPVNKTVIYPDYRRNSVELAKIISTIDSVKNDKDITVTSLSIKGFASPEGSYENNVRLAKGRTNALKSYVEKLYKFPTDFISTDYEAEDWEGLRDWVMNSDIENKEGILSIIDSDLPPDPRNTKIQTSFPVQYKFLLDNVYPGLRHSDYKIEYNIRQFTDISEIMEVFRTTPEKLSLSEMYTLASNYEPGSEEYNEVFETAVRLYPDDEIANLNAANAAMSIGNLYSAEKYLQKAGNSAETIYARGILAALRGDRETAQDLFRQAENAGLPGVEEIIEELNNSKIPDME